MLFAKNSYEDRTCRNSEYSTTCRIVVLRLCLLFLCQKIKGEGTDMYYLYVPTETLEVPVTAERLLRSIGATGRLTGFTYVHDRTDSKRTEQRSVNNQNTLPGDSQTLWGKPPRGGTRTANAYQLLLGVWG